MRKDKTIELITVTTTKNAMGDIVESKSYRKTFARKKSISQSEFHQAMAHGMKPEIMFVVWTREYKGEQSLKYNEKEYNIYHTYEPNSEEIELKCQGVVNSGDA